LEVDPAKTVDGPGDRPHPHRPPSSLDRPQGRRQEGSAGGTNDRGQGHPPDYADNVPVYLYRPGEWKRELYTAEPRGILHSITPVRWQGRGEQLMTADFLGIRVFLARGPVEIAKGDPRPCPQCGSSEIKIGHLGKRRFIAAIEPWHGNQVVVY